jgi:hypothetical protein
MFQSLDNNKRIVKNILLLNSNLVVYEETSIAGMLNDREYYDGTTIQRIAESLLKGGIGKYDKG